MYKTFDTATLRAMREQAGITQDEMAKLLDVSEKTVRRIEKCQNNAHEALSAAKLLKWYEICKPKMEAKIFESFSTKLRQYFARVI